MSGPELLPCPFCGGEAYLRDDTSHSTAYFIGCTTMDCFGEIHWGQTEAEAVTGWNTRAPLSPAALAELPEVKALLAAERERCAKIAEHFRDMCGECHWPEDAVIAGRNAANDIAAAIREGLT